MNHNIDKNPARKPNRLIHEKSPYLLQHAYNPVDWHPWNRETLEKALKENKMMLISIGYSSCHWCHVMEKESFENEEIATIMNEHFVCIKIDREERPDVDSVYMNAVVMIHGHGGWPLNCFTLPDGRPFYGGTYFPPERWKNILLYIIDLWYNNRPEIERAAQSLSEGLTKDPFISSIRTASDFDGQLLSELVNHLQLSFDPVNGGFRGAPKFPMPVVLDFLLQYGRFYRQQNLLDFIKLTLLKMATGGIYDQLGGGFARYAVDARWKVPHFEKMLYDNAQLISLYANAYLHFRDPFYLQIARESTDFVLRELTSPEGMFYSALDADSEGEEGKFYVWREEEFNQILGDHAEIMKAYFGITSTGNWENNKNVLVGQMDLNGFCQSHHISTAEFARILSDSRWQLFEYRKKRIPPLIDDKCIVSWNSLMINALMDIYIATGQQRYLDRAQKAAEFIIHRQIRKDFGLYRIYKEKPYIEGLLEDYAFFIEALIKLFQVTGNVNYLMTSRQLLDFVLNNFYDESDGLFWNNEISKKDVFLGKKEVTDQVIPSANSTMAGVLYRMGIILDNQQYRTIAEQMVLNMSENLRKYPSSFARWATHYMKLSGSFPEIIICGMNALQVVCQFLEQFVPHWIILGTDSNSQWPVFQHRYAQGKTKIYICRKNYCLEPVESFEKALDQIFSP